MKNSIYMRKYYRNLFTALTIFALSVITSVFGYRIITAFPLGFMHDDAYFYSQIAYNLGTIHISTFDGKNITDGYHLLWGWLLGAVSYVISFITLDKNIHLMGMLTVYFLVCFSIAQLFGKTLFEKITLSFLASFPAMLMETTLLSLLLLIFFYFYLNENLRLSRSIKYVVLFLLPLTRIDGTIIVLVASLLYLKNREYKEFATVNGFLFAGAITHFTLMKLLFGSYINVSSASKVDSVLALKDHFINSVSTNWKLVVILLVLLIIATLSALATKERAAIEKVAFIILALLAYLGIHMATNMAVGYWYFIPAFITLTFLHFRTANSGLKRGSAIALVLIMSFWVSYKIAVYPSFLPSINYSREFVGQVKELVPEGEFIYQVDGSGYIGYFSNRNVVNGDGLVNNHQYIKLIKINGLKNYLRDNRIKFIIANLYLDGDKIIDFRGLVVYRKDVSVLVEPPPDMKPLNAFALYKIKE